MRNYPFVPVRPVTETFFGIDVEDPYRDLEDAASEETRAIVRAENEYTHRYFENQPRFSAAALERELRARKKTAALTYVNESDGVICATRTRQGEAPEIVRLDEELNVTEVVADDARFDHRMHLEVARPCPKHPGVIAILATKHGAARGSVIVYDLTEKRILAEVDGTFNFNWSADGEAVLYSHAEPDTAHNRNVIQAMRCFWQENRCEAVYTHPRNAVSVDVMQGPAGGLMIEAMNSFTDVSVIYRDADGICTVLNDGLGENHYLGEADGCCYFKQIRADAPLGRIVSLPLAQLRRENALMTEVRLILRETDAQLGPVGVLPDGLLALSERNAASVLSLYTLGGQLLRELPLPCAYGSAGVDTDEELLRLTDAGHIYLNFESFTQPSTVLVFDAQTGTLRSTGNAADADDIAVDQCFVTARDGQRILVYLVRPKNLQPDGNTPVLMFGYGGYAFSLKPCSVNKVTGIPIADWVRRGRIYAHCILRGGSEYGAAWHEAGMAGHKKNAFYDFIDIAEYLVQAGWTRPEKLIATGSSNGGLLVTAVATLRPDLFGTVIASVPHTDMLRFRNDARGMMYVTEYGDPKSSREMFEYMYSYSPYHNIRPGTLYPRMYVQTGEMDNNVPPYHGKKFAVRMQHAADERHPVLLEVLAHGSHDRGTGDEYEHNISQAQTFIEIGLAEEE